MTTGRRAVALYALPLVALFLAAVFQLNIVAPAHAAAPVRIVLSLLAIGLVFATVFATLHHAEAIAHHIGEPYGTLVLTFAVTTIEVSVIVSMMLHGANNPTLARESVFSTVMIVCGGVIGICLTLGGLRHRRQELKRQGTNAYLSMLTALAVLTLILRISR
jgi:Ca2+:H+ antiporter